jgi:hypothetical protein
LSAILGNFRLFLEIFAYFRRSSPTFGDFRLLLAIFAYFQRLLPIYGGKIGVVS